MQTCSYRDAHGVSVAGAELLVKQLPAAHRQPVSVEFEAAAGAHRNGGGWQYDTRDSLRNTARDFLNMLCAPQILD